MKRLFRSPLAWLAMLAVLLPAMLVMSAYRTYRELDSQRLVYLRGRAAAIAARLETLPGGFDAMAALEESEPGLEGVEVWDRGSAPAELQPLFDGTELFRTGSIDLRGARLFRAFVPFHGAGGELRLARIDLAERSADFLLEHATHHLWITAAGALMIVALCLLAARSMAAAAKAQQARIEMLHLAKLGEMSAVLAHEIRNPLGTIKGFAQLLGERANEADAALLEPILSETGRLEGLVKDLLAFGRPAKPVFRKVETGQIAELLERHARGGGAFRSSVDRASLVTDPDLLEQALLNLLRNAREAAGGPPDGLVQLEIRAEADSMVFRILDNGPGFSVEAIRRLGLGDAFYTTKASGTGLGLSITRRLAESLGGVLELTNRSEGGASAQIRLPLNPPGWKG